MNLSKSLAERKATNKQNIPAEKWAIMETSTNKLKELSLSTKALQTGDILPTFTLPDVNNKSRSLSDFKEDFLVTENFSPQY